ncbi:polymorphic toxin-type HINT domain-containing protein [Streptomyces sp. NBC_00385]|uniref:polymorphic toxin-type HINT domain-containing protein n=1 Tax=Streptomyces sp. NBC_00385 TaxID=2975733 RepID=UPI002DDB1FA0|nr:polymorphic toxin-type HINT domain-containing protein [Streptomyces sp. NBC_00385]WRZ03012.1 polymorphic toxin-type HINT domain-containing protein [Streptomyces sp. NBC_00385]
MNQASQRHAIHKAIMAKTKSAIHAITLTLLPLILVSGLIGTAPAAAEESTLNSHTELTSVEPTDRGRVLNFWKIGGPGVKAAAEVALSGDDTDVQRFLDELSNNAHQDNRVYAAQIASVGGQNTIEAARQALSGTPEDLKLFLDFGWKNPLEQDERVRTSQIIDEGGPGVQTAGRAALNGTAEDVRKFLTDGQYAQRDQDQRIQVAQILSTGGPAVQAAGRLALSGSPDEIREFLEVGQHVARARDQEHLTVSQLAELAQEAGRQATAETVAATDAAARAVESSKLAKAAALQAASEAAMAGSDANKAASAAARAATTAGQAAAAARQAISSAQAANNSARTAANAASQAASAAAGAARASARARGAAAAAATDATKAAAARKSAEEANAAAHSAEVGAAAADQATIAATAAGDAAQAAAGAGANAMAAANAATEASSYADQSDSRAIAARAAAAAARRHAQEATRAANAAVTLARKSAVAAGQARDAATSAAKHARASATAANEAADHAGDAASAATKSTAHATAAQVAADAALAAVEEAKSVTALAREVEAAELLSRTNAGIERAKDLKEEDEAREVARAASIQRGKDRVAEAQRLATEAAKPDADPTAVVRGGRKLAVLVMQDGGPWSRAAAEAAVAGTDQDVTEYVRTGWTEAAEADDRSQVERLSVDSPLTSVSDAAEEALMGDATTISTFLASGQYEAGREDFRVSIAQVASVGGPVLKEAGQAALAAGTLQAYRDFLGSGQTVAREQDERVRAAQLVSSGGSELKAAARIALEGPAELLHNFIESGQYMAARKDLLSATHVAQIQGLIFGATSVAATAQADASEANRVAALARKAAQDAQKYKDAAAASSDLADYYDDQASKSAADAAASAAQAAESARIAQGAAASAQQAATKAAVSAADATVSSELAHVSAASAWTEAKNARASAIDAGKDAEAARTAGTEALQAAIAKIKEEAKAEREKLRQDTPAERMRKCGILGCPPENDPFYCDKKPPTDPFCTTLSLSKKLEPTITALFEIGKAISGLSDLEDCINHDLWACAELMKDVTISSKLRLLKVSYETLRALTTICETCFPAGTKVLLGNGKTRNIEDVKLGDKVMAADPLSGRKGTRHVTRLVVTEHDKLFNTLTMGTRRGTEKVTATYEHPFWNSSAGKWTRAADLRPGTALLSANGSRVTVQKNVSSARYARTYNLTVDDLHTYYVMAGQTSILVHNSGCSHIALGRTETSTNPFELEEFAMDHGAEMYKHWPDNKQWYNHVKEFLKSDSTTRISFNLNGIGSGNARAAAARGESVDPARDFEGLTDWELYQISQSPGAWSRITWYEGGIKVDNPFE